MKKSFLVKLFFLFALSCYAQQIEKSNDNENSIVEIDENSPIYLYVTKEMKSNYERELRHLFKVTELLYIAFHKSEYYWDYAYFSDGNTYLYEMFCNAVNNDKTEWAPNKLPQLINKKLGNYDAYIADFNFDGKPDIFSFWVTGRTLGISIEGIDRYYPTYNTLEWDSRNDEHKVYFENEVAYFEELNFIFCIKNGKRGFLYYNNANNYIEVPGGPNWHSDKTESGNQYYYSFYAYNKNTEEYELEEEYVSPEECMILENYFDYDGLDFSLLDGILNEYSLENLTGGQLRIMRNAIYARHGRTFKSVDLQSLWNCYTWYKENPNFSDSLLTDIDRYNIKLIQKYENKK